MPPIRPRPVSDPSLRKMTLFSARDTGEPRTRIFLMIFLLALVISLAAMFRYESLYDHPGEVGADQEMIHSDPATVANDPLAELPALRDLPPIGAEVSWEEGLLRRRHTRSLEGYAHVFENVFAYLKSRSLEEIREEAIGRAGWSPAKLVQHPSRWRGRIMHVYGELESMESQVFPDNPPGLRRLYLLILRDPHTLRYSYVLTPTMPASARTPTHPHPGSFLAADGVYLMNYPLETQAYGRWDTPFFVSRQAYHAVEGRTPYARLDEHDDPGVEYADIEPTRTIPGIDRAFLIKETYAPPKDGGGEEERRKLRGWRTAARQFAAAHGARIETAPYRELATQIRPEKPVYDMILQYLWHLDPEVIADRARASSLDYTTLMRGNETPEAYRGRFARFEGLIQTVRRLDFEDPTSKELGLTRLYVVTGNDVRYKRAAQYTWTIVTPNLPPNLKRNDTIIADGIFVKLRPYRRADRRWHWSPLLVAPSIQEIDPPVSPLLPKWVSKEMAYTGAAVVVVAILAAILMLLRASSRDTDRLINLRNRSLRDQLEHEKQRIQGRAARAQAKARATPEAEGSADPAPRSGPEVVVGIDAAGQATEAGQTPESGQATEGGASSPWLAAPASPPATGSAPTGEPSTGSEPTPAGDSMPSAESTSGSEPDPTSKPDAAHGSDTDSPTPPEDRSDGSSTGGGWGWGPPSA